MKPRLSPPATALNPERPVWQNYGFAGLMFVAALVARWSFDSIAGETVPLSTMYAGVVVAVYFAGWRPAALLAITGYFAALWWFVPPRYAFKGWESYGVLRTGVYFVCCATVIYLCESMRRARRRHALSEAKVVSILENMAESFCSVDAAWRINFVNRRAETALGQSREKMLGRVLWEVLPDIAGQPAETELRRALLHGTSAQFETRAFAANSWHAITVIPTSGDLWIFAHDITAQKAHIDQLERLVDERTAALQGIVADLESFSYTLVHDMRAPLRSISAYAELLAADHAPQLDADGKTYVGRIRKSAVRMDQLITDILSYSRLSCAQPDLRTIDLDATVREILRSHPDFHPENADIAIEGPLPQVSGNDVLLTQCFSNLLHNATKFVAPGVKPRIRISARMHDGMARVEIADNGIGISPAAVARIFEPFRRENPHYDGTGIGLAIVRKVVEHLDGRVGVESQEGHGSRFWVELKLPRAPLHQPKDPAHSRLLV